jgi:hypothetical protein
VVACLILIKVSGSIAGVAVGDFNHDGKLDIAEVNNDGSNTADVLLGNGDGTFRTPLVFNTGGARPSGVAVGDLNGEGLPDLVVANAGSNSVTVLLNDGNWPVLSPASGGGGGGGTASTLAAASTSPSTQSANLIAMPVAPADVVTSWLPSQTQHRKPGT